MGALVLARVGAEAAVALQQPVDAGITAGRWLRGEADGQVVEGALQVVGLAQGPALHPHHAVALAVGKGRGRAASAG